MVSAAHGTEPHREFATSATFGERGLKHGACQCGEALHVALSDDAHCVIQIPVR